MKADTIGLLSLFIVPPLLIFAVWTVIISRLFTEKAESYFPQSEIIKANKNMLSSAGLLGEVTRNSFLTFILMMPGMYFRRGLLLEDEVKNFPKNLKILLFVSWGGAYLFFFLMMVVGVYGKYLR